MEFNLFASKVEKSNKKTKIETARTRTQAHTYTHTQPQSQYRSKFAYCFAYNLVMFEWILTSSTWLDHTHGDKIITKMNRQFSIFRMIFSHSTFASCDIFLLLLLLLPYHSYFDWTQLMQKQNAFYNSVDDFLCDSFSTSRNAVSDFDTHTVPNAIKQCDHFSCTSFALHTIWVHKCN